VCKVHHAIADGMGGAQLLATMFSSSPDLPTRRSGKTAPEAELPSLPPPPIPTELEMLKTALGTKVDASKELVRLFRRTTQALGEFYERRTHEDHNSGASVFDAPRTCWNEPITGDRIAAFTRISQEDVRAIRKPFDATAHEVLLAICAGALRSFLQERGELPNSALVVACPVAVRSRTPGQGSNRISAMLTSLATHIDDPVSRLASIRVSSRGARAEHDALGGDMLASWAELVFPGMFKTAAKLYTKYRVAARHRPIYNLVVSNVTGPRKPLYFGGARMVAAYPLGPIVEGAGLNITVMSYGTEIDFGMVAARTLLPDLADIAGHIREATAELLAAAHKVEPKLSAPRSSAS
jgi:diacylglycerol O-acyltransferase